LMQLDLADLESVEKFAKEFLIRFERLNILINNAGVMMPSCRQETIHGFELQFGTNHIGHFALTKYLIPRITQTPDSRVVNLSSLAANMGAKIHWDDPHLKKSYRRFGAYAQSKLANLMFSAELQHKFSEAKSNTISVAAHPGATATNLPRHFGIWGKISNILLAQKLEMGILPTLRAATDPNVKGGEFYGPDKMGNFRGHPIVNRQNKIVLDRAATLKLWKLSEQLSNIEFQINSYDHSC